MSLSSADRKRAIFSRLVQLIIMSEFFEVYRGPEAACQTPLPNVLDADLAARARTRRNSIEPNLAQLAEQAAAAEERRRAARSSSSSGFFADPESDSGSDADSVDGDTSDPAMTALDEYSIAARRRLMDGEDGDDLDDEPPFEPPPFDFRAAAADLDRARGPRSFPPIVRALYELSVRSMPIISNGAGDAGFADRMDLLLDDVFLAVGRKMLVATRTDALHLAMHYSSMVVDLFREEHQLSKRPVPSIALEGAKDSDAAELKSRFASELLIWQNVCTRQLANKSFSAARPLVSEPHLDLGRMKKAARFVRVLRSAFRSAFRTVRLVRDSQREYDSQNGISRSASADVFVSASSSLFQGSSSSASLPTTPAPAANVPMYWRQLNSVKTYNELPETYVEFMNFLPTLIAYVLDNTLDNPSRLRKISVIVSKLPVSFIIMSLRFVNPAPLIERMLRLFLWSPSKGIYSLVQKLASHLCALESTNTRYKRYKARASSRRCIEIETIATKDGTIASLDTETQLRAFFRVRGIDDLSAAELKFAIICIRKREKEAFINALAEPATINFIIHMARLFPELLDDIAKYGDLANIVGQFFDSLRRSIHSLERYSKYRAKSSHSSSRQSHASSRHSYASSRNSLSANESDVRPSAGEDDLYDEALDALSQEIVQDIQDAWYDFLQSLFPALQKVASAAIAGKKSILVSMVDWFMRGITRFVDLNDAGSLFGDLEDDETPSEEPAGSEAERSTMAPPPSHTGTLGSARTRMSRKQSIESFFGFENFPILDHALAHLTHDELSTLWDESEKLIDVALQGLDQRLWPEMPILNGKAVDAFRFEIIKLLSQSDKLLA